MIRRYATVLILFSLVVFQGCAKLPSPEEMAAQAKDFQLPAKPEPGNALVYVVRPSALGTFVRFNVFLDDKEANSEMGYNRGSQYIYFSVNPGRHLILSKAENWAEVTIDAKEGDIIFVKQDAQMGIIMARNSLSLIDAVEGKYHVMKANPGTIKKTRK